MKSDLDRRQLLLDENSRIAVIINKAPGSACSGLPLDEAEMWQEYRACLLGESHRFNDNASRCKIDIIRVPHRQKRNSQQIQTSVASK